MPAQQNVRNVFIAIRR